MKSAFGSILIISLFLPAGAGLAAKEYDLVATGDHSVWVITNDIKADFERDTGLSLDLIPELAIVGKGCAKGMLHARRGRPDHDVGLICCDMDAAELEAKNLKVYPFAREPLAIVVNKRNPVNGLTLRQVRDIFSGKTTNWKSVGGRREPITVLTQLHCPDFGPNWKKLLGDPARFVRKRVDIKAQAEMSATVADFPQAIGHLEMTSVRETGDVVKVLAIDGYLPTTENMEAGRYPLFGSLAVATKGEAAGKAVTFIEYLRTSPKAKERMRTYGMIQVR
ncbi:MAG: substrate-binding domain-containing protein [Nitrospiraceae bacterium]|nr:substrate-binding domain-containing protein [Nitrospiraceae bacterium]